MRPCFTFTARAGDQPAVLALDEEIGFWGTQAKDFRSALDAIEGDLVVEINSVGGDVMAGLGMFNMLRTRAAAGVKITTRVTGIAASIASIIALAGDTRQMPRNSFAMIHQVSTLAFGTYNADELRDMADVNDKITASLRNIYVDRMGVDEAKATELMSKDTYLTAQECLDLGFATELTDPVEASAKFDLDRAALPEHVRAVFKAQGNPTPPPAPDPDPSPAPDPAPDPAPEPEPPAPNTPVAEQIVNLAKEAGFEAHAAHFAVSCATVQAAKERIAIAREVKALCVAVGQADFAASAIRAGQSVAEVRTALIAKLAEADTHIDTAPPAKHDNSAGKPPAEVTPTTLWESHNANVHTKKGR